MFFSPSLPPSFKVCIRIFTYRNSLVAFSSHIICLKSLPWAKIITLSCITCADNMPVRIFVSDDVLNTFSISPRPCHLYSPVEPIDGFIVVIILLFVLVPVFRKY